MATIFSKIIEGTIPCYKVHENEEFLAFFDISPLVKGHTLVIPKIEVDQFYDMEDDLLQRVIVFSKEVAVKIKKVVPCKRIGVTVIGLEVAHAHIHLIPINVMDDMNFANEKLKLSEKEFTELADLISKA